MTKKILLFLVTAMGIILLIIVTKDKKKTDDQGILKDYLYSTPKIDENRKVVADFSKCNPDNNLEIKFDFGKAKMTFKGILEENCIVETSFETQQGSYTNECKVPKQMGMVEFDGYNFDKISKYCYMQ